MIINAEVWVEGLTDRNGDPAAILAQVETDLGFGAGPMAELATYPLHFDLRVDNNYRFAWELAEHVGRSERGDYRFRFRFSADRGESWYYIGTGDGPDGGDFRSLLIRRDSQDRDPAEPEEHCEGNQLWEGAFNVMPYCLDYLPDAHHNAEFCEFYVNAFGRGQLSHNHSYAEWLEAYVNVLPRQGELLNVGMLVRHEDRAGELAEVHSLGREIEPDYWLTGFTIVSNSSPDGRAPEPVEVQDFAFFIDLRREGGEVVRLWQSAGGGNYTLEHTFSIPGYEHSIGIGTIEYADQVAELFDPKHTCR